MLLLSMFINRVSDVGDGSERIPKSHLEYSKYLTNRDMKENCNFTLEYLK